MSFYFYRLGTDMQATPVLDWSLEPLVQIKTTTEELGGRILSGDEMGIPDNCLVIEAGEDFADRADTRLEPLGLLSIPQPVYSPPGTGTWPPD